MRGQGTQGWVSSCPLLMDLLFPWAQVQSSVPGEIILFEQQRVEPVNGLGDVGEVPAVRVSNARAWKTNLGFVLQERNN